MNRIGLIVVAVIAVCALGLQGYQYQQGREYQRDLARELSALRAELQTVKEDNERLRQELAELQGNDLDTLVDDASEALVTGWNSMLTVLENELRKAEQALRDKRQQDESRSPK
ncbi:septum formation initiator family protein [Litorivivens sp.]|uniref:FtsB family cell division protein n=1 Tax=Litorivivens sp. TaxID=2020868 RepID=UPI003561D241